MAFLVLKMVFRKGGTTSAILAVALLVAILAFMSSIANHVNSQAYALSKIVDTEEALRDLRKKIETLHSKKAKSLPIDIDRSKVSRKPMCFSCGMNGF